MGRGIRWSIAGLLFLTGGTCSAAVSKQEMASDVESRMAVVRIEAAVDPFSIGPDIVGELASRRSWDAFEAEVARRLDVGATGTGFFVNADGFLVTNAHVLLSGVRYSGLHLSHASWDSMTRLLTTIRDFWVTVGEGDAARDYLAVPVALAEDLDLAVLRVRRPPGDNTTFSYLAIGSSAGLRVGRPVHALGFPEYEFQATAGEVISLIHGTHVHDSMQLVRDEQSEAIVLSGTTPGPIMRIQHSAPTGHGSSGGPLVDDRGRVLGVAYAVIGGGARDGQAEPGSAECNLGIASDVLRRFLRTQGVSYMEAAQ
jgi:S1-C subfamily serine protease